MDRQQHRAELIQFLHTIKRRRAEFGEIDDDQSLIESGLIDSLAAPQIVAYLEELDFLDQAIDPSDLKTVGTILDIIEHTAHS